MTAAVLCGLAAVVMPGRAMGAECPNEQLRQESNLNSATGRPYSMQLPACRAYELVSPGETDGWEAPASHLVAGSGRGAIVAQDGMVFFESQASPSETGAIENGFYMRVFRSYRTPDGWITRAINPTPQLGNEFLWGASEVGTRALVNTTISLVAEDLDNPTDNTTEHGEDLYVLEEGQSPQLVTHGEVPTTQRVTDGQDALTNSDLSAVAFTSAVSLMEPQYPGASTAGCYIWDDEGDHFAVLTNPVENSPNPPANCVLHAVTDDGRAVITVTSGGGEGLMYATFTKNSFPLDAAQISGETPAAASFEALSPNGETVYINTTDKLTANNDVGSDIYGVNLQRLPTDSQGPPEATAVTCVSCEAAGPNAASVSWVGQSADGSHVYFRLDNGDLYEHDAAGTRLLAPATDGLSDLIFSPNGQHAIAVTSQALLADDTDGTGDIYELSPGETPQLITSDNTTTASYEPVAVSDSGERVIYEEEGASPARAIEEYSDGTTTRLSPVAASQPYSVLGIVGRELENVFFEGHQPLVPQDLNAGTTDIYDARIGGGFPAPHDVTARGDTPNPAPPTPTLYTGDLSAPSARLAPLPANTSHPTTRKAKKALRCKRGFVKNHGKCVATRTAATRDRTGGR